MRKIRRRLRYLIKRRISNKKGNGAVVEYWCIWLPLIYVAFCLVQRQGFLFVCALLLVFLLQKEMRKPFFLLLCALFFGVFNITNTLSPKYPDLPLQEQVILEGEVESVSKKTGYTLYRLRRVTVDEKSIDGKIILSSATKVPYQEGDRIIAQAKLRLPEKPAYDGDFDDFLYTRSQSVLYRATATSDGKLSDGKNLIAFFAKLRGNIAGKIEAIFRKEAPLAKALILGEEEELTDTTRDLFGLAGITHILAISGSHVVLLCGLLSWLLKKCRIGRDKRFWLEQAFLLFYLLLTGFRISMLRAVCMYEMILLARQLGRKRDSITFLAVALFGMTAFNPASVFQLGLQLSFGAVFCLILLTPIIEQKWLKRSGGAASLVAANIAVNIGLLPILINVNHSLFLPGFLINLAATMYATILIPALFLLFLPSMFFAKDFFGAIGDFLIQQLTRIAALAEKVASWQLYMPTVAGLFILLLFVAIYLFSDKLFFAKQIRRITAYVSAAIFVVMLFFMYGAPLLQKSQPRITLLPGQGLALVIETKEGKTFGVQAGNGQTLATYLLERGEKCEGIIMFSREKKTYEEMDALTNLARYDTLYADERTAALGMERYALPETSILAEEMWLSDTCRIKVIYETEDIEKLLPVGIMVYMEEKPVLGAFYAYPINMVWEEAMPFLLMPKGAATKEANLGAQVFWYDNENKRATKEKGASNLFLTGQVFIYQEAAQWTWEAMYASK